MSAVLVAAWLLGGPAFAAKAIPPAPPSYVYNEGVISAESAARIGDRLAALERSSGHQFVVALFDRLEGEDLETYVNRLFRAWRIGRAGKDDGLLFCLFQADRRWRVEVGYGLEPVLTDLEASEIVERQTVPRLRAGDADGGVEAAVSALAAKIAGGPQPAASSSGSVPIPEWAFWLGVLLLYGLLRIIVVPRVFGASTLRSGGRWDDWDGGWGGGGWGGSGGGWGGGFSGGGGSSGGGGASGGW